jgi:hypothetical protein
MSCDVEMHDSPCGVLDHQEHVEDLTADGGHGEEVHGDDLVGVVLQEGLPALGWRLPSSRILGHGGLTVLDAQLQQFAVNPRDAPGGIGGDHLLNQLTLVTAETGPSLTSTTALSPPERPESASVPSDHGFGLDDDKRVPPALPDTTEENPDHAVAVVQCRAFAPTAQNLELMAEGDVLEDQRFASAKRSSNQV